MGIKNRRNNEKPQYTIAIDPSINNCGYAVFNDKKLVEYDILQPSSRKMDYLSKAREIVRGIGYVCEYTSEYKYPWDDLQIVTEIPQHFGGSVQKGFLARESGDVYKLTFICGMIYNITTSIIGYTPNEWKAQLPKCVVRARIARMKKFKELPLYKKEKKLCAECKQTHQVNDMDHNILDAIGIGIKHIYGGV